MEKNKKIKIFIGVLYSTITVMLILIGSAYTISYLGACISAFIAYNAFKNETVNVRSTNLKKKT